MERGPIEGGRRRSCGLAPSLPGLGACWERSTSSVISVAGCLQLGKPRRTPAPHGSSAPVRWLLFLFLSPGAASVRVRRGLAGCANPAVPLGKSTGRLGRQGFVQAVTSHSRQRASSAPLGFGRGTERSDSPKSGEHRRCEAWRSLRLAVLLSLARTRWVHFKVTVQPLSDVYVFCTDLRGFRI